MEGVSLSLLDACGCPLSTCARGLRSPESRLRELGAWQEAPRHLPSQASLTCRGNHSLRP